MIRLYFLYNEKFFCIYSKRIDFISYKCFSWFCDYSYSWSDNFVSNRFGDYRGCHRSNRQLCEWEYAIIVVYGFGTHAKVINSSVKGLSLVRWIVLSIWS